MMPSSRSGRDTIAFMDGVQRIEVRVIGDNEGKMVYGAFASVAVGAVFVREGKCVCRRRDADARTGAVRRRRAPDDARALRQHRCSSSSRAQRTKRPARTGRWPRSSPMQNVRRDAEIRLGEALDEAGHEMVVVDGRLNWQPKRKAMVIGLDEDDPQAVPATARRPRWCRKLSPKMRTPIFRIGGKHAVYSWYLRLTQQRPIDHPWAGVIRLETLDSDRHRRRRPAGGPDGVPPAALRVVAGARPARAAEPVPGRRAGEAAAARAGRHRVDPPPHRDALHASGGAHDRRCQTKSAA